MFHPLRAGLSIAIVTPALIVAGLQFGGSPESAANIDRGPLTCHAGFCNDATGSSDMFWPWIVHLPTGSAGSS
ncbi:hypothetical protein [Nocardia yamanashiensis]|uniref:hypothetical protein n=1 Tax=Nocardia yamanashiensis TaxID=209247 RepID=UPI000AAA93D8|nr:hypothetical protein [Nocardia yamanashiensis]